MFLAGFWALRDCSPDFCEFDELLLGDFPPALRTVQSSSCRSTATVTDCLALWYWCRIKDELFSPAFASATLSKTSRDSRLGPSRLPSRCPHALGHPLGKWCDCPAPD